MYFTYHSFYGYFSLASSLMQLDSVSLSFKATFLYFASTQHDIIRHLPCCYNTPAHCNFWASCCYKNMQALDYLQHSDIIRNIISNTFELPIVRSIFWRKSWVYFFGNWIARSEWCQSSLGFSFGLTNSFPQSYAFTKSWLRLEERVPQHSSQTGTVQSEINRSSIATC